MKKTALLAVALATCLGYVPAQAAEVVSSNIVGYEKISLAKGFNAVGVQFTKIGGEALDLASVGTLDSNFSGPDVDTGLFTTELMVWDPTTSGYDNYGWSGTIGTDVLNDPTLDNIWMDSSLAPADDFSAAGSGFWINGDASGTMTISGEVPSETTKTAPIAIGFNMVANPYPAAVKVSDFGKLDESFTGPDVDTGLFTNELMVWNPKTSGYDNYGWSGTIGTDVLNDPTLDHVWLNESLGIPEEEIPFGGAVWINAASSGNITFTAPSAE